MVDTAAIKELINSKGLKINYICQCLGIADASWRNKIDNKSEFKLSEVAALCKILDIDSNYKMMNKLFFAEKVD